MVSVFRRKGPSGSEERGLSAGAFILATQIVLDRFREDAGKALSSASCRDCDESRTMLGRHFDCGAHDFILLCMLLDDAAI
jgi:hypothetical protein